MIRPRALAGPLTLGTMLVAVNAPVAHGRDDARAKFELTPFAGYQFGGAFDVREDGEELTTEADVAAHGSYAVAFDLRTDPLLHYEFLYARQPTRIEADDPLDGIGLDVEYLHFGGTAVFGETQFVKPYSIGTLGVTRLSLDAPGTTDEVPFSISIGVGLRVPVKERFAIRLEARAFFTFLETDSAVFCGAGFTGASCVLRGNGSLFAQYALLAGAAFAF